MIRLLKTRRWIAFSLLVVVAITAFGLLSRWQWERAAERERDAVAIANSQSPVELDASVDTDWQPVAVTGTYLADEQLLIRRRPLDTQNGFWVITPLRTTTVGDVWIVRGWLGSSSAPTEAVSAPLPPAGDVRVIGRWRPFEREESAEGLPPGQVMTLSGSGPTEIDSQINGFVQLRESTPSQEGLVTLPLPEVNTSQNISYAIQWLLFAAVAIVGWLYFLRREAKENDATRVG